MKFKQILPALAERLSRDGAAGFRWPNGGCAAFRFMKRTAGCVSVLAGFALMRVDGAERSWNLNDLYPVVGGVVGGSGTWNTSNSNWTPSILILGASWSNSASDTAIFGGTDGSISTVTLGSSITAGGLIFNTPNYVINGNGNLLTLTNTRTITTNNGNATINAIITGTTMTKEGIGTLILSGANTYTGVTNINNGTISVSVIGDGGFEGNLGKASSAAANLVFNGGTLRYAGASASTNRAFTINAGKTATFDIAANNLTVSGASSATNGSLAKTGAGTLTLSGANTYTGITTLTEGVISVSNIGNGGSAGNLGQASNAASNLVFNGGTLRYTGASASTDRAFTINADKTATFDIAANDLTVSGASAATNGSLAKIGAGTLTLSGANAHTGLTDVQNGTIQLSNGSLNAATTLNLGNGTTSGKFILGGASAVNQTIADLTTTGTGTSNAVVGGNASVSTLTVNKTSGASNFAGILGGGAGNENKLALAKTGNGTLTLSGANAYTGGTTVSAGMLVAAHASALGSGAVVINGGALVSSVSSVNSGSITLSSGSLKLNNAAAGAYVLGVDQDFNMSGGTLEFTLNEVSNHDRIQGSGSGAAFSITGGTLHLEGGVPDYSVTYQIFSGFSSGEVSGLEIVNYDTAGYTANLSNGGVLSFTAIPEPGAWALGGMGALFLLAHRRRSRAAERA